MSTGHLDRKKRVPEMYIKLCTVIHVIGNIALSSNNEKCSIFNVKRVPEMYIIQCTVIHEIGNIALSSNIEKCFIFNVKRVPEMSIIPCRNVLVGFTLSSRRPYTFS